MERRLIPRILSSTGVKLYFNGSGRISGQLDNFSQGGVAISLDDPGKFPGVNETVLMLPDNMDEPYTMKALRCHGNQWVLVFTD